MISRLACASIVAADGGAPVIFDDALGWSDPRKLERMGAVISRPAVPARSSCSPAHRADMPVSAMPRSSNSQADSGHRPRTRCMRSRSSERTEDEEWVADLRADRLGGCRTFRSRAAPLRPRPGTPQPRRQRSSTSSDCIELCHRFHEFGSARRHSHRPRWRRPRLSCWSSRKPG